MPGSRAGRLQGSLLRQSPPLPEARHQPAGDGTAGAGCLHHAEDGALQHDCVRQQEGHQLSAAVRPAAGTQRACCRAGTGAHHLCGPLHAAGDMGHWRVGHRPRPPPARHHPHSRPGASSPVQVRYRPAAAGKGRSQPYQKSSGSASAYKQIYYGSPDYVSTDPTQNYTSPVIHTAYMPGLEPDTTYEYQVGDAATGVFSSKVYCTKTLPLVGPTTFPFPMGLVADLGQTANSSTTLDHLAASKPIVALMIGDLTYADEHYTNDSLLLYTADLNVTSQQRWDSWGRFTEPVFAKVPLITVAGNHEIEYQSDGTKFASYTHRYPQANTVSGSPTNQYYSLEMGPAHVLVLSSYIPFFQDSPQYAWLKNDLANNFDRQRTPWLIATFHAPVYNTYLTHYKENECFRQVYEPLFFQYGVDAAFSGHVHAYERSEPVYNYEPNGCGTTYITIGDGGNTEQLNTTYVNYTAAVCPTPGGTHKQPWYQPEFCPSFFDINGNETYCPPNQPEWSAYREPSFGHGVLDIMNATHARWSWNRNQDGLAQYADVYDIQRLIDQCPNKRENPPPLSPSATYVGAGRAPYPPVSPAPAKSPAKSPAPPAKALAGTAPAPANAPRYDAGQTAAASSGSSYGRR